MYLKELELLNMLSFAQKKTDINKYHRNGLLTEIYKAGVKFKF